MTRTAIWHSRLVLNWFLFALALGICCGVQAQQSWPTRPIRLVITGVAGNSTDVLLRLLAQEMSKSLGQAVIIENRPGANGIVAATYFINSPPNDHVFLAQTLSMMSVNQFLYKLTYDPETDLKPIGLIADTPNVFLVHPSLPVATLKELGEYGKANPDKLSYSSGGVGGTVHLLAELLKSHLGFNALHVPYNTNAPATQALIAGDVQFNSDNVTLMVPLIRAGKVRALAVTSPKRLPQLPEVPTVAEAGFPDMTFVAWWGLVGHSKTPPEVIARMNRELVAILQQPDFIARLSDYGLGPLPSTPEEMGASIRKERARWKKVIETAGIQPQ